MTEVNAVIMLRRFNCGSRRRAGIYADVPKRILLSSSLRAYCIQLGGVLPRVAANWPARVAAALMPSTR